MISISLSRIIWALVAIVAIVATRVILNLSKLIHLRRYFIRYKAYLANDTFEFSEHVPQIIHLFKEAGVSDFAIMHQEMYAYGNVALRQTSGFANLGSGRQDVVTGIMKCFHESIGIYRHRMWQSINPLFWIELLWKLPEHLLGMVGVLPEKVVVKVAQLVYWLLLAALGLKKLDVL